MSLNTWGQGFVDRQDMIRKNLWVLNLMTENLGILETACKLVLFCLNQQDSNILWDLCERNLFHHPPYHQKVLNLQGGGELLTRC